MKSKLKLFALGVGMTLALPLVMAGPATAAVPQTGIPIAGDQGQVITEKSSAVLLDDIDKLGQKTVAEIDGVLTFDLNLARSADINDDTIRDFAIGVIVGGGSAPGLDSQSVAAATSLRRASEALRESCRGKNASGVDIWGRWTQLDSCRTRDVIYLLDTGANVATIAGAITAATGVGALVGAVAIIVAALLAIGKTAISYCSRDGNGVVWRTSVLGNAPYCTGP